MAKMVEKSEVETIPCPNCRGRGYTGSLVDATYKVCPRCNGKRELTVIIKRPVIED